MGRQQQDDMAFAHCRPRCLIGVAAACGYVPMVSTIGVWFVPHRAVGVRLAVAGIGVGTLVLSPAERSVDRRDRVAAGRTATRGAE